MQSGPGSRRRSRGSGGGSLRAVAGTREGSADTLPLPRPGPRARRRQSGLQPVPDPAAPLSRPTRGGEKPQTGAEEAPRRGLSPLRPGRRLPGGCAGPRGAAAGSGRRAAPPAPLPAITHPRILFIHKNTVMR